MRKCEVVGHDSARERFQIRWLHNHSLKEASRFNLTFERENQESLESRRAAAHKQRAIGDIMMRFHYTVEETKV